MNESDLRSDVHYLGSSENKAWLALLYISVFKMYIFIYL